MVNDDVSTKSIVIFTIELGIWVIRASGKHFLTALNDDVSKKLL